MNRKRTNGGNDEDVSCVIAVPGRKGEIKRQEKHLKKYHSKNY